MRFHGGHQEVLGPFNVQPVLNVSRPLCIGCVQNHGGVYTGGGKEKKGGQETWRICAVCSKLFQTGYYDQTPSIFIYRWI